MAGNYVPGTQRAFLRDKDDSLQLTVVMTSSHGVGSFSDGHLELMLHRRCLQDDGYGVGEVLDEADHINPTLFLILDTPRSSTRVHRRLALLKEFPNTLLYGAVITDLSKYVKTYTTSTSLLRAELPENIHLLSFIPQMGFPSSILRLQHVFALTEDPILSNPVDVDLSAIFSSFSLTEIVETTLSANQPLSAVQRPTWRMAGAANTRLSSPMHVVSDAAPIVTLKARDLRTFVTVLKS